MNACDGNVRDAAVIAGVYRTHLYKLLARHGFSVKQYRRGNADWQALAH